MNVSILGSGAVGSALGALFQRAGHTVAFGGRKGGEAQVKAAQAVGGQALDYADAAAWGEAAFLTVPWAALGDVLPLVAPGLAGKVVVSTVNALKPDYSGVLLGPDDSAAETVVRGLPGARVVECLVVNAPILASGDLDFGGLKPTVPFCGDDAGAKATAATLLKDLGLDVIDAGPLALARLMEPAGLLAARIGGFLGRDVAPHYLVR